MKRLNENSKLQLNEEGFIENTEAFQKYLNDNFKIINVYPELHLQAKIGNRKATGEADLVLETEEGFILIDYKSFPGKTTEITTPTSTFYAAKYSGQLNTYKLLLE